MNNFDNEVNSLLEDYSQEFKALTKEYLEYNSHTNISAIRDEEQIYSKHYCDSLILRERIVDYLSKAGRSEKQSANFKILDLGSGGGFPVLPLAITMAHDYPSVEFTALDSVAKKTKFIDHVKEILKLENLRVLTSRAEILAHNDQHRESYDLVLARSVANLPTLLEYCIPYLKPGACLIASKSRDIDSEIDFAQNAFAELNASIEKSYSYEGKQLLFIKKLKKTNPKYPRSVGKPLKDPL